jgi:hypothetical protein
VANLALLASDPLNAAVAVSTQTNVTLTFNQDVQPDSVTRAVVQVFRGDSTVALRGALSSDGTRITFVPEQELHENALYNIRVIGANLGLGYSLRASDGTLLAQTIALSFRTGTEAYVPLSKVTERDDIESVGPIREGDPLAATPTGVGGSLQIDSRKPAAFANVSFSTTGITLDFDRVLDPTTIDTTSVAITQLPALGIEEYWATIPTGGTVPQLAATLGTMTPPTGSLFTGADKLTFLLDPSRDWLHNTQVSVEVTTDVKGADGTVLLAADTYIFTTTYAPLFISPTMIRLEIGPAVANLTEDTILRLIHKASIEAWDLSGRNISFVDPPIRIRQWVEAKTILDILGTLMLTRDLRAGESKTLGDLSVQYKPVDPVLTAKYKQALETLEQIALEGDTKLAEVAIKGESASSERWDFRMRTWDHLLLQATPAANLNDERSEKARLSVDYAFAGNDSRFVRQFFISSTPSRHTAL